MNHVVRIGTRGSPLALVQAEEVRRRLAVAVPALGEPDAIKIVPIRTTGDRNLESPLSEIGGKGLFTKELEDGLMAGTLDIAVHSMKDMPTALPSGLVIAAQLPREDVRDALLVRNGLLTTATSLVTLPYCAVVGTSSLRRQSQLLALRPDCRVVPFRGNVDSRIGKVKAGLVVATMLALARLKRLGRANQASAVLDPSEMLPAVSQGAIAIQCRADASRLREILSLLHCRDTGDRTAAERALLSGLEGNCRTPIAALAMLEPADGITLVSRVALPDGSEIQEDRRSGRRCDAEQLGFAAAENLRLRFGTRFRTFARQIGPDPTLEKTD